MEVAPCYSLYVYVFIREVQMLLKLADELLSIKWSGYPHLMRILVLPNVRGFLVLKNIISLLINYNCSLVAQMTNTENNNQSG